MAYHRHLEDLEALEGLAAAFGLDLQEEVERASSAQPPSQE